jgi:hypothetical protein
MKRPGNATLVVIRGEKMFLLGDLPIIGDLLFSSKDRKEETTELIIFITPTIILHPQDEAAYLDKRFEITNFKNHIEQYKSAGTFPAAEHFPKDTLFGLNGQETKKSYSKKAGKTKEAIRQKKQDLLDDPSTETEQDKFEDKQHRAADENPTTQEEPKIAIESKLADTDSPTEAKRYSFRRKRHFAATEAQATDGNTDSPTETKGIEKASSDQSESYDMRILSEEKPVGRCTRRKRE